MVLEKAHAQRYGGWGVTGAGGLQHKAVEQLTGRVGSVIPAERVSISDLARRWHAGEILGISTIQVPPGQDPNRWRSERAPAPFRRGGEDHPEDSIQPSHAMVITEVNEQAGTVTVMNPWYRTHAGIVLTVAELKASIAQIEVNA